LKCPSAGSEANSSFIVPPATTIQSDTFGVMPVDAFDATISAGAPENSQRQILGERYELLGLLGSGGMGNVYKARDLELDELVALKVLKPHLIGDAGELDRFRREVKLARRVTHPNVARVFDIGELAGDRILTMELVDGESLGAVLRREGRLQLDRTVQIARAICAGVGAAHAAGVVHRDLKPDNVLVANDGRVVVTDFGIARAASDRNRTGGFVGTPAYMAPEQIDERATIDHRADIYAFGTMLYEMLVGAPAWQGQSLWAVASARLLEPPPDPRIKRSDLPQALAQVVLQCMARDPAARARSMEEIDRALAAIVLPQSQTVSAPAPPRAELAIPTTGADKRVAVLPLANLGPPEQEYVADGLTEDLIDALSVARGLRVRSRGAVMRFKGATRDPREIGQELDVQVVVEGSVRKGPAGYRINARLVSVADGFQLWARRFDVPEQELLVQNDLIARAIAEALTVDLTMPDRVAADGEAVDLYLRARHAYHHSFSGRVDAVPLFDRLLTLTPDDPRALAGRALAGTLQVLVDDAGLKRASDAAERAVALAPMLPDAHVARAGYRIASDEPAAAVAPLHRALRLSPNHAEAHEVLGRLLAEADCAEGVDHLRASRALEPTFEFPYLALAKYYELHDERANLEDLLEVAKTNGVDVALAIEARFCIWRRDRKRAEDLLASSADSAVRARSLPYLEFVVHGTTPQPELPPAPPGFRLAPFLRYFILESEAEIAAFRGDYDAASGAIGRLGADGAFDLAWLDHLPLLEPIRGRPEFIEARRLVAEEADRIVRAYRAPER